jgi:stage II sporulation protein P
LSCLVIEGNIPAYLYYMDRIWTKRGSGSNKLRKRRAPGRRSLSALHVRLIAAGVLLVSMLSLALLTTGPASERLLLMAMPVVYAAPRPTPAPSAPSMTIARVDVDEGVGEAMRIEVLSPKAPPSVELGGSEPRILIYHTHYTEAYTQTEDHKYVESGEWRTYDESASVVAVGELLAQILRDKYGCNVIHDKTNHEPPKLATSYSRSEVTMKKYKEQYPSLTMFIDVHRDAGKVDTSVNIDGKKAARLMFVVGTGEGATGTGYKEMPDFESNYALALAITNRLAEFNDDLARNVRVKTGRYNQHISSQCLLAEVGDNANTLEEALNAVPYLAQAIVECSQGMGSAAAQPASAGAAGTPTPALRWVP